MPPPACPVDSYSFAIHRYRHDSGAGGSENIRCSGVARVFHPDRIAGVQQQPCDQIERLLRARGDQDLIRIAADSARATDIFRNRLAQWRVSATIALPVQGT